MINKKINLGNIFSIIFVLLILFGGIFFGIYFKESVIGKLILNLETDYSPNETLKGGLSLSLRQGELIPADTLVNINIADKSYDYTLSELVSDSAVSGDYFIEGKSVLGNGQGYGLAGEAETFPDVEFVIKVISSSDSKDKKPKKEKSESETTETTTEETTTEETTETTTEETTTPETTTEETTTEETTETTPEETTTEETTTEETTTEEGTSLLTGGVVTELTTDIPGVVSKDSPYIYELEEGQTAEIVSSSKDVDVLIDGNIITITTDYSEITQGFGEKYLGDYNYGLEIDFSKLEIIPEQGVFILSLTYGDEEIASISHVLNVGNQTSSEVTQELLANDTEQNITLGTNITSNISLFSENILDYALTEDEINILKSETGESEVKITKSEIINNRLIVRFEIGSYWLENSYDSSWSSEDLNSRIKLDRAKWVKILAKKLSEGVKQSKEIELDIEDYKI